MPGRVSTFGRRVYKLTRMLEDPVLWQLRRYGVGPEVYQAFNRPWFKDAGIDTVIDIGANTGQFTQLVHAVLPQARIYAFEPLPDCFATLVRQAAHIRTFKGFNVGLGSTEGTLTFHRNPYADSSSFRPMTDLHRSQFPFTAGQEALLPVPVRTLDSFGPELDLAARLFVKIDVQGYEDEVLAGGEEVVSRAYMVSVEVSFAPLYECVPTFDDIYKRLTRLGFAYRGNLGQLVGPLDGAVLQADAFFVRAPQPTETSGTEKRARG